VVFFLRFDVTPDVIPATGADGGAQASASPLARGRSVAAGTVTLGNGARWAGIHTDAADWCLSSDADSHETKASIERRESESSFSEAKGEPGGSPGDRRKSGSRVGWRNRQNSVLIGSIHLAVAVVTL